jgi:DNA repair exonuclease SbcCD ATPase subunit
VRLDGSNRNTESLIKQGKKKACVRLTVMTHKGTRQITREVTKSRKNLFVDNGFAVSQKQLEEHLGLPDLQYFLQAFLPTVEGLNNKEGRDFFIKLLKRVDSNAVKAEMDPALAKLLHEHDENDPDFLMRKLRKEIKDIEKDLRYIEGQMDLLNEKAELIIPEPVSTKEIEEQLEEIEKQLYSQVVHPPKLHDTSLLEREIMRLELEMEKTPAPPQLKDTLQLERELKEKRQEYIALLKNKQKLKLPFKIGDECPTCMQKIRDLSKLQSNLKKQIQDIENDLTALEETGKLTREELEAVKKENEETMKRFEEAEVSRKQKVQKLIEMKKEELNRLLEENKKMIEAYENSRSNDYLTELEEKRATLKKQLDNLRAINTKRELLLTEKAQAKESIDKLEQMKKEHNATIYSHKERIKALQHYNEVYVRLLNEQIKGQFKRVSLKLLDINKETGEIKDVFEVRYDDKPVHVLSYSERIRAGLELAQFVQNQLGMLLPTFVDNVESITHFEEPPGQFFTAGVVKGKKLEVMVMEEKDAPVEEQLSLEIG